MASPAAPPPCRLTVSSFWPRPIPSTNMIRPMGSHPEPWPVTQQDSSQTGASTPVPRPENTPDLSAWTGTGRKSPPTRRPWRRPCGWTPNPNASLSHLPPKVPAGVWIVVLGGVLGCLSISVEALRVRVASLSVGCHDVSCPFRCVVSVTLCVSVCSGAFHSFLIYCVYLFI